jgi:hypothetical protein
MRRITPDATTARRAITELLPDVEVFSAHISWVSSKRLIGIRDRRIIILYYYHHHRRRCRHHGMSRDALVPCDAEE